MTAFPSSTNLTDPAVTQGTYRTALGDFLNASQELPGGKARATFTISGNAITPTTAQVVADTAGGAGQLNLIVPTNFPSGRLILVSSGAAARPITLKHNQSGTGKLIMRNSADLILTDPTWVVIFEHDAANGQWIERFRNIPDGQEAQSGYFSYVSATSVKLAPRRGNKLRFPNGFVYTIPSAGLTAANTGATCYLNGVASSSLAASTTYFVYLWYNAGTPVIDFSTTGRATDATTGLEIKSGADDRLLIGMVKTNASSQFADSYAERWTISWLNREIRTARAALAGNRTTSSTSLVEVTATNAERPQFLCWAGEVMVHLSCYAGLSSGTGSNGFMSVEARIDAAGISCIANRTANLSAEYQQMAHTSSIVLADGSHAGQIYMLAISGTTALVGSSSQITIEFMG